MKKAKRNAILSILFFLLLVAGGVYMAIEGVGENKRGKAEDIPLGLDLQGGLSVTYEIQDDDPSKEEIDATIDKLQRRVDAYSTEGEVYKQGDDRIVVEIPVDTEKDDAHKILDELGKPGQLFFFDEDNMTKFMSGEEYVPVLTGADVKDSEPGVSNEGTEKDYVVSLIFTDEGAEKFTEATRQNIGKRIYIVYDGEIISDPNVKEVIDSDSAEITGMEDYERAERVSSTIKIGALPLELEQLQYNIVGAKLGSEAVSTSITAGAIGFGIICVIMIVIYLVPGFIAVLALGAYILLLLLILSIRSITLTLPGIAGILLSIGMAVDANVIIFTRIKEEIAAGKNAKNAVSGGFSKALSAILDGNITTLIATIVLMTLGTGSIKGFATTLMVGILLSMFTALVITKMLLNAAINLGIDNIKFYGKAKEAKVVNFVKYSRIFMIASALVIVAGLAFLPINKNKNDEILNFSLEFTGGTSTTVELDKEYSLEEVEADIVPAITEELKISAQDVQVQMVEDSKKVIIKTPELSEDDSESLQKMLETEFNGNIEDINSISSTISGEMRKDAIIAIAISSVLMLLYIAFRFSDFKFGISAVIALLHDVMIVFTIYSIGQLSVGNTFIACMLTIVGYSINATIIIFDRIRENQKTMSNNDTLENVVNTSIAQTFTRTIYTSLTTFVMVLVLFIMGVSSLKEFTLTLMAGIVCGAYSSVCITGPLWYLFKKKGNKKSKNA